MKEWAPIGVVLAMATQSERIYDDQSLLMWCVGGSLAGAIVSIGLFEPPNERYLRGLLARFVVSFLVGMFIAPICVLYAFNPPYYAEMVASASFVTSMAGWGISLWVSNNLLNVLTANVRRVANLPADPTKVEKP